MNERTRLKSFLAKKILTARFRHCTYVLYMSVVLISLSHECCSLQNCSFRHRRRRLVGMDR